MGRGYDLGDRSRAYPTANKLAGQTNGGFRLWYPLSFLPSILLWVFLCDENALLAFPRLHNSRPLRSSHPAKNRSFMGTNYLYAPNDAGALLGGRWWGLFHLRDRSNNRALHQIRASHIQQILYLIPIYILLGILCPLLAQSLTQYPLLRLMTGIDYYRFPMIVPNTLLVVIATVAITPGHLLYFPTRKEH